MPLKFFFDTNFLDRTDGVGTSAMSNVTDEITGGENVVIDATDNRSRPMGKLEI